MCNILNNRLAHGSNDVAFIMGPYAGVLNIFERHASKPLSNDDAFFPWSLDVIESLLHFLAWGVTIYDDNMFLDIGFRYGYVCWVELVFVWVMDCGDGRWYKVWEVDLLILLHQEHLVHNSVLW